VKIHRIQTPEEGNPLFPLPLDYEELSTEGKRQARVNACRQWLVPAAQWPGGPRDRADARVESTRFFDLYYLHPDPEADFDPFFYDDPPVSTPEMHWDLSRDWALSQRNLGVLPRGSGKSSHNRKDMLLVGLARPAYSFIYATSSHDNATYTGQTCKDQWYENQRIFDDWSPEYGGRLKPNRGDYPTGVEYFYLTNGSWIQCISANSRQRGKRPRRYRLDDPEYDPTASTSMSILRSYMEQLLFKIVLPMVMRPDTGVDWLATFVSKRHYAWHAMQTKEAVINGEKVLLAEDPRFNYWTRYLVRAAVEDPASKRLVSCWPEMWPAEPEEKTSPTQVSLPEIRDMVGPAVWNSEYMGKPGTAQDRFFPELTAEKHGYHFEDVDPLLSTNPRASSTLICFQRKGAWVRNSLHDFLLEARLFICIDTSYTSNSDSDSKVLGLFAHLRKHNELFLLDLWSKRCQTSELMAASFKMADLWLVPSIHPELVKESYGLYHALQAMTSTRAIEDMGLTHTPKIVPIKPGTTAKVDKIASLDVRFDHGLIKYPLWKFGDHPYRNLLEQIEGFNPEANDGGLAHDDELDVNAMAHLFVAKGRQRVPRSESTEPEDAVDLILEGHSHLPDTDVSLGMGINWLKADPEKVARLLTPTDPKPNPSFI
jgi:hypothetical protein